MPLGQLDTNGLSVSYRGGRRPPPRKPACASKINRLMDPASGDARRPRAPAAKHVPSGRTKSSSPNPPLTGQVGISSPLLQVPESPGQHLAFVPAWGKAVVTFIKSLPQPLKALYVLAFAVFGVGFATTVVQIITADGTGGVFPLWFAAMGAVMVLIGICLAADLNSSARATSEAAGNYRPMGMENSRAFAPSPGFVRLIGAFFVVGGAAFIFVTFTQFR